MYTYHHTHHRQPMSDAEAYHRLIDHNKHLIVQIKMAVIFFIGGVIIVVCVAYIVNQCRTRLTRPLTTRAPLTRQDKEKDSADTKRLFGSSDTLDDFLATSEENSLPLKVRNYDHESNCVPLKVRTGCGRSFIPLKLKKDAEFFV